MDVSLLFLPLALLAGALLTVQAGANLQLRLASGSPLMASALQLAVGTLALLALAGAVGVGGALRPLHGLLHSANWWHLLGGLGSAVYIAATILVFPRLGAVVAVGLTVVGQMLASLVLDVFGLVGVTQRPLSLADMAGAAAMLVASAMVVRAQGTAGTGASSTRPTRQAGWIALAVVAGAVLPVQGAINALLRADLGTPVAAGTISFVVATIAMLVVLMSMTAVGGEPAPQIRPLARAPWWAWIGGLCGAIYVTSMFTSIPVLGAAVVVGLTIVGQQVGAVLFDRFGLMRLPRRPVTWLRLAGVLLLMAGVLMMQLVP